MLKEGIINLLKPAGMTSHDAVYFLRRLTGEKKIGHTGTLDPMAVGVLPMCLGNAAKIIEYLENDAKAYRCEMLLGVETDTQDIWGTVQEDRRDSFDPVEEERIRQELGHFKGEICQTPPMYSSVRIRGRHLYEYARAGEDVKVKTRQVRVDRINLVSYDEVGGRITFDVVCSKGTYIRSICRDLGDALGCGGTMSFLARTANGMFRIENAVSLEELERNPEAHLMAMDLPLGFLGRLDIPEGRRDWYCRGGYIRQKEGRITRQPSAPNSGGERAMRIPLEHTYCVYCGSDFLGVSIYHADKKQYLADKVFQR